MPTYDDSDENEMKVGLYTFSGNASQSSQGVLHNNFPTLQHPRLPPWLLLHATEYKIDHHLRKTQVFKIYVFLEKVRTGAIGH